MSEEPLIDEEYASEEDTDFDPDAAPAGDQSESESDNDDDGDKPKTTTATPKRKKTTDPPPEDDFDNSGDEAVITKGQKRHKKAKRADGHLDDDEGGEGGLIKTRSQRAQEKAQRKSHAVTGPVTIDIDDVWAKMVAAPLLPTRDTTDSEKENKQPGEDDTNTKTTLENPLPKTCNDGDPSEMIKIKRTYNFAGKVHTEEKLVPRNSAEAKLYLASQDPKAIEPDDEDEKPKRNPRKAFRSMFEPAAEGLAQRADLNLGMTMRLQLREQQAKAKKLNVVEKSRMDWAGFVDKEGIKDELELAGKSKESYANRQDFLLRVEANKEEEARRARIKGRG
ncbi:bucentaur or craniofacial development-domain-containing protein [Xylariaceae sp. FL0255]|nr:bucentaur or craniofacial development-domain-containing protein [Xylariaceae sp. FL0255]